ncbi:hypothetical protein PICST_34117 [Scheffersomyces stipitis CBS 6054]|uniref:Protein PNS1 n=1 Tax=Scheffersomyces stipitis (strain ATCC 58785 / CBS 6054 / NBRC 10063 / NRRL Y-11545) TaxID=322104 RepID=A3GFC2_PICST|nr:predicted protein [Scheffersomyces stipitis CBS 6054]EAZ63321.1 hypothetical protein PICST_34117 [Scheffersomyces stipitis CBS 6054]
MQKFDPPSYPPPPQYSQEPEEELYDQTDLENGQFQNYSEKPVSSENFEESFKIEKPKWNDWPFTLFFLAVVVGFVAVAVITINALRARFGFEGTGIYGSSNTFSLNTNTIVLFAFVIVVGLVLSTLIMVYARMAPRIFITTGLILNVVLGIGTAIYYFVVHYYSAAIVFLVFSLFSAYCYWSCRSRIPFSATVLEITIDVMKRYPSTLVVSLIGIIASAAFSALFSIVIVATYVKFDPNPNNEGCSVGGGNCSQAKLVGVLVFVFFAGFYISEVFRNVIHVVIAGIYGTWYYLAGSDQGAPRVPALGALKRALTYCFGSICFGSLIVAFIQLLRAFIQALRQNALAGGDNCAFCALCILDLIVGFIDWMVRYFNHYAYCYVALYGKSYLRSAKDTFDLLRYKGMDALINDCFINTALNFYALFVAFVTALLSFLYLRFTEPDYNADGNFYAPVMAFAFLISGQITRVATSVIESGISTFFVALAKDPEVFQMTNRNRFDEIFRNYPQVLQKITSDH